MRSLRQATDRVVMTMLVVALASAPIDIARAQQVDTARVAARRATPAITQDSARPPISPKRAFLYSFLLPGYGQSVLDRPLAGAFFFGAEVSWIAMATKAAFDLRYAKAHERDSLVVTYAFNPDGSVKVDSLGNPVGATFAPNRYASDRVAARKKHLEDYFALIVTTHLLAGAEAFVAAQLWDLPTHVSIKAMPFGPAVAASIRW